MKPLIGRIAGHRGVSVATLVLLFLTAIPAQAQLNVLSVDCTPFVSPNPFTSFGPDNTMGMSLQQVGLVYTTAGKAGFITSLYVVLVPILALFWKRSTNAGTWIGAALAAIGLYFLSVTERFTIEFGDLLVFFCAFFWAGQVLIISWLSPKIQSVKLAFTQFVVCAVFSFVIAIIFEEISLKSLVQATWPILYNGILSSGVAFTFQVVAQRHTHPAHASIIMSMEAVFAAIGGWLILNEVLGLRGLLGCGLMLCGMLLSQLWGLMNKTSARQH